MKAVSISGSPRENVGKKDAKKQRNEGNIPCVLYGGKDQVHFATPESSFKKIVYTSEVCTVKININGKEHDAILQDIQYHPVSDKILHADFLEVSPEKPVTIHVPVKLTGSAPGVLKGGKLHHKIRKLKIQGLLPYLPDDITLDISSLEINDSIKVSDIVRDNITLLDPKTAVVVGVRITRVVVEETPTAEGAAPAEGATGATATPAAPAADDKGKEKDKGGKDKGKEKK
ncbi:MAG TPA: 50S ribosomal protein L25/general stress protein Ctc [Bacteroidales bacterium]|nr:50S ribosomal protein L25/general stress protein Ctc [Bacteroidales bacterium]HPS16189.1 50S ribosomal protein L25/general stress protein Ctc [Bacteroidales bacterium]